MRREFDTKVAGLETHIFNIGHSKYAAKFNMQREYKGGKDLELPILSMQTLAPGANQVAQFLWQGEATDVRKRMTQLAENKQKAYVIVIKQISPELVNKIKETAQDAIQLLLIIDPGGRSICARRRRMAGAQKKMS